MICKGITFFFLLLSFSFFAQQKRSLNKVGLQYSYATEDNFLFNDKDYSYNAATYKVQLFYELGNWKSIQFEILLQPQIQYIQHQLLNSYFVLPTEENFEEKITEFTKPKNINLLGFEVGFNAKRKISNHFFIQSTIGLGVATISNRTERLAKGFTFIENAAIGFLYETKSKIGYYLGITIGHVSNFNTQKPNSGYNQLGLEIGLTYKLK